MAPEVVGRIGSAIEAGTALPACRLRKAILRDFRPKGDAMTGQAPEAMPDAGGTPPCASP